MASRTYLTLAEIAHILEVHPTTVLDMVKSGKLTAYQPTGPHGRYRVRADDFRMYLNARQFRPEVRTGIEKQIAQLLDE